MRPKCLPDNREASVRASERMCESEREDARKRGVWRGGASERDRGEDARKRRVWRERASEREARGSGECGEEKVVSRTGTN